MLNLLKFKAEPTTARSARASTASTATPPCRWSRRAAARCCGWASADQIAHRRPRREDWDSVALVQYPSRKAFIEMVTTPEYEQAHEHRESGLERTVLIACTERAPLAGS